MKFLVVGCGSIGKRHLQNLNNLSLGEVSVCRIKNKEDLKEAYGAKVYLDLEEALSHGPQAVLVTTPTSKHIPVAMAAVNRGCHVLIEKPLSDRMNGVDEFIKIASKKNQVVLVGCNMRFHPGLRLIRDLLAEDRVGRVVSASVHTGQYLPDWHPWEDYRNGYSANKELGGGVLLDLIHELDYLYWFFGEVEEVSCFMGKHSALEIDTEDMAKVLLKFGSGITADVHLDYIQRRHSRTCKIIGEEGTLYWDYHRGTVELLYHSTHETFQVTAVDYDRNLMYIDELKHFVNCIQGREDPLISAMDGKKVLEIALAAKESARTKSVVAL
ncbi:MAG: Gfo/Idh/MocA family protein [Candidatus Brocadiales bacterium]